MAMKRLLSHLNYLGHSVMGYAVGTAIADHVGHLCLVDGSSMQPVLNPEENDIDVFMANRWSVRNYQVQRGDIVTLTCPIDPHTMIVKRVIALEGDTVKTLRYKEPYVTVPQGHCWVEGDNREISMDSNYFGPMSRGLILAKATYIVWPPRRWQRLSTAVPSDRAPLTEQDLLKLEEEIGTPKL